MKAGQKKIDKISRLILERNNLYVSKLNPKRLKEIIEEIDYINYGIISKEINEKSNISK